MGGLELNAKLLALGLCAFGVLTGPAAAHHSFAMFDNEKVMTLKGTVKEFQWTNPHTWIQLNVRNDAGVVQEWSIEGASVISLSRQGWKRNTLKVGDDITVLIHPLKNGEPGGSFMSATFADGSPVGVRPAQPTGQP
jgi:hypothetical protein